MYVILPLNTTCTTAVHNSTSHHQLPIKFTFRYFQHTHCNHGNTPVGTRHIMNTGVTYEWHRKIKFQKIDTFPNDYHILGNFRGKKFFCVTYEWHTIGENQIFVEKTFTNCLLLPHQKMPHQKMPHLIEKTFANSKKTYEIQENFLLCGVTCLALVLVPDPKPVLVSSPGLHALCLQNPEILNCK